MPAENYLFRNGSAPTTRDRLHALAATPAPPKLYAQPTAGERTGRICLLGAGLAVCGSIGYAVMATIEPPAPRKAASVASTPPATFRAAPVTSYAALPVAANPLRWDDLTLMLRTGLSDDEIIGEALRKQLVVPFNPAREEVLRGLGAGSRLLAFLRTRPVYAAPAFVNAARPAIDVRAIPATIMAATAGSQPAPAATPDYAAHDRQIQTLKTQIDALDEEVRCVRANPKDNHYWWHYSGNFNGIDQQKLDAFLNELDRQRNDLRRQKWQLEGR